MLLPVYNTTVEGLPDKVYLALGSVRNCQDSGKDDTQHGPLVYIQTLTHLNTNYRQLFFILIFKRHEKIHKQKHPQCYEVCSDKVVVN